MIFSSLAGAPFPDPTPTPPNTPKWTRNGPETEPNGAKRSRNGAKRSRNGPKSSFSGWDGRGVCRGRDRLNASCDPKKPGTLLFPQKVCSQKGRKGVGGKRVLARGDSFLPRDSCHFCPMPPISEGERNSGRQKLLAAFWALSVPSTLRPTPFLENPNLLK